MCVGIVVWPAVIRPEAAGCRRRLGTRRRRSRSQQRAIGSGPRPAGSHRRSCAVSELRIRRGPVRDRTDGRRDRRSAPLLPSCTPHLATTRLEVRARSGPETEAWAYAHLSQPLMAVISTSTVAGRFTAVSTEYPGTLRSGRSRIRSSPPCGVLSGALVAAEGHGRYEGLAGDAGAESLERR